MDDLLREFLVETKENLDTADVELVRLEQEPGNARILGNIFRLVHTIKGTCGFLDLPRLAALSHAAETLMGRFRDGTPITRDAVTLILAALDRVKEILAYLEAEQREPEGADDHLITALEEQARRDAHAPKPEAAQQAAGTLAYQVLERPLYPGEDALDDLERAFRETPVDPPAPEFTAPQPAVPVKAPEPVAAASAEPELRAASQSIRVNVDTLEHLMTMVSELVLTRNQLLDIARRQHDSEFKTPLQRLSSVTAELQDGVMKTRMQPIAAAWQKLPRIVRDLASELGKEIDLQMHGADTELDRQVIDLIRDPLTHMVRNCADHGLEPPGARDALGKPPTGTIRLSAYHEGGHIIIEVSDDGRGLDCAKIRSKAVDAGLLTEAEAAQMSDAQAHKLIFLPGFSTARTVTNISGRGVGMDVVKHNIDQIGGAIEVSSVQGEGCTFLLKIPLTLAIVPALIVETGSERFAIPQLAVVELVRIEGGSTHRVEHINGAPVLRLRQMLLPLVHLADPLKLDGERADSGFVVVMQAGGQRFGVIVEGVFDTEEIVVKPLAQRLRHIKALSGNTILGDGAVIMILDPNGLAAAAGCDGVARASAPTETAAAEDVAHNEPLLVFRAGSDELKAVPLSLVTRLEEIDTGSIENANGRPMVQYRGHLMPLVTTSETCRIRTAGAQPVLVFSDGGRAMGLAVDEIVDIVEDRLAIEVASATPGVLGCAIVKGRATEIVDVAHFLPLAFEDWFRRKPARPNAAAPLILLVDDAPFFRNLLPPVLRAAGYDVVVAADGNEALAALKSGRDFAAVFTDIEMPEMDGFALARAIRADARMAALPLIAISAHAAPEMQERIRAAGFRAFVAKFDRPALVDVLKALSAEWAQAA